MSSHRTGARRICDVPKPLLAALEAGQLSSATHAEHMAIDQRSLWRAAFPELAHLANAFDGLPFIARLRRGGELLVDAYGELAWRVEPHESDMVRAWRAFAVGAAPALELRRRLELMRPFAVDSHFAVREWAWLSARPHVCAEPHETLSALTAATGSANPHWRRFATEVTRPRSVWGKHIATFKADPAPAEQLLVPLLGDHDLAVITSVTNWLNDVCQWQPAWVASMCRLVPAGAPRSPDWFLGRATRGLRQAPPKRARMSAAT